MTGRGAKRRSRRGRERLIEPWAGAALLLFVLSRVYLLLWFEPDQSDMWLYVQYAWEDEQATKAGEPLFPFHLHRYEQATARALQTGVAAPSPELRWIEYPPLALRYVALPKLFLEVPPPPPPEAWPPFAFMPGYGLAFRTLGLAVDGAGFLCLLWLVPRLYPRESPIGHFERWLAYVVGGHVLGHLLYDRLTLVLGIAVLLALALLVRRRLAAGVGLAVMAVAINFQLSPLVLTPVIALGTLRVERLRGRLSRLLLAWAGACAVLIGLTLLVFLPFYLHEGPTSLGLLRFHSERGLNTESVLATLPLLLSLFGHPVEPRGAYQCWNLVSPLTPTLVRLSMPLVALLVMAVALVFVVVVRRQGALDPRLRVGVALPAAYTGFVLAGWVAAIAGSKVFSPQYLCWLLPLVPLLPGRRHKLWFFVLIAVVTTVIFPYAYDQVSRWGTDSSTGKEVAFGPTPMGVLLLSLRNVLFVLFGLRVTMAAVRAAGALRRRPLRWPEPPA